MYILLAGAFMLGAFVGMVIICLLIIAKGSEESGSCQGLLEN
jgi:hypothetical protein